MHDSGVRNARRRSMSASRPLDSTVNFVGRIGASLRISSRKRAKEKQKLQSVNGALESGRLRLGVHYAKVGLERRRSACSAIFMGGRMAPHLHFADEDCAEPSDDEHINAALKAAFVTGQEVHHQKRYKVRSNSVVSSCDRRLTAFVQGGSPRVRPSADFGTPGADLSEDDDEENEVPYVDGGSDYNDENDDEDGDELLSLALVPLPYNGSPAAAALRNAAAQMMTRSALSSPLTVGSGPSSMHGGPLSRSCPSTPQMPARRRYLREGIAQLTSLATLCTHNRYFFLFNDLLLISKQKGENSYKLKEKVSLDRLWISSNNCTHSFVIGWPIQNFVVLFSSESEKNEWFAKLSDCIKRRQRSLSTTISVAIRIEGRQQVIRREIDNGVRASEIVSQLIEVLDLPTLDPHLYSYELCFERGGTNQQPHQDPKELKDPARNGEPTGTSTGGLAIIAKNNTETNFQPPTASAGFGASFLTGSPNAQITALNGVESVYAILMDYVFKSGLSLSDSQLAHLDTCPLVNVRLVLRKKAASSAAGASVGARIAGATAISGQLRSSTALNFMHHFRKVLHRSDSAQKSTRIFGRQLEGSMPPQPVLTMIDHLSIHGTDVEGIFRRCPKKSTAQELKVLMDQGHVPDFNQYNVHVTAGLLKEYLRDIPGNLLISANYHLWMEVVKSGIEPARRLQTCRNLLKLLPPSHTVLLRNLLRLLRRVAGATTVSRMGVDALAVCLAPSLIVNPAMRSASGKNLNSTDSVAAARRENALTAYLIHNANDLFDECVDKLTDVPSEVPQSTVTSVTDSNTTGSDENGVFVATKGLHQSTDSGLSDDPTSLTIGTEACQLRVSASVSPDSALFEIPTSEASSSLTISEPKRDSFKSTRSIDIKENNCCNLQISAADDDRTPVISRENSDVKTQFPNRYLWRSHLSSNVLPHSPNPLANVRIFRLPPSGATRRSNSVTPKSAVASVDELRVSDFIISAPAPKKFSVHQRERDEIDELYAAINTGDSPPTQKISNARKISGASNTSDASQVTSRQSALVTTSATLGITTTASFVGEAATVRREPPATNSIGKASLSRRPALSNADTAKLQLPETAQNLKRINSASTRTQTFRGQKESRDRDKKQTTTTNNVEIWQADTLKCKPAVNTPTQVARRQSDRHSTVALNEQTVLTNDATRQLQTRKISVDALASQRAPAAVTSARSWRPPKRTAEEIVLDNSLEVNWSVSSIRSVFQQQKDDKPAAIDTVYAKFEKSYKST